jgi:hypothetical protein
MKPKNLIPNTANVTHRHESWSGLIRHYLQPGSRTWQRIFTVILLASMLLVSPLGTMPAQALAPTLLGPTNHSTTTSVDSPPLGIPEFSWTEVSGATNYQIQISANENFTTWILSEVTYNTTYTPYKSGNTNLFSDGTWYWHVKVNSPGDNPYSATWDFSKQWATPANAPSLNAPANGATIDFYDEPIFSWGPVMGAAKYKLQIYQSPGGWASPTDTVTTLTTTHQPSGKYANGLYYWRVVPLDNGNHEGTPSVERSFTANYNFIPQLLEPENDAEPTFTPTFSWTAVRGAQKYRLEYTTDPTFNSGITSHETPNTSFTPIDTLPNDQNYYWRVRAQSGASVSGWSEVRSFIKRWYIKPVLLTPTNGYQYQKYPLFSWTPVPGARRYHVVLSKFIGLSPVFDEGDTGNTSWTPNKYDRNYTGTWYWNVTPNDGANFNGLASNTGAFKSPQDSLVAEQVYPLYYYSPNYFLDFPEVSMNPYEDRTVPLPIFMWHQVLNTNGEVYPDKYRLQVTTDIFFDYIVWDVDTENTMAAPTSADPFTPVPDTTYYWRVSPLIGGEEVGQWSPVWKARFDLTQGLAPTVDPAPVLLRPIDGYEYVETTPLLEWYPKNSSAAYDVEISTDISFEPGYIVDSASVPYPAYVPLQSLARRNLGAVDFGVYYWRVRESGDTNWSEIRRFQIAAQSQYRAMRSLGDAANQLQIGSDPVGDVADADYDLTNLQVAQSGTDWIFGFQVPAAPLHDVTYALYLDLDHKNGSGADHDARGFTVATIPAFRPEFAIYVRQISGSFNPYNAYIYSWVGGDWNELAYRFSDIGGYINYNAGYLEFSLPNTNIGYQSSTGSFAITLLSLPAAGGVPQDSVPSDPDIPNDPDLPGELVSRFANVSEQMNLIALPNNDGIEPSSTDPSAYPSILPFSWDWPVATPFVGAVLKVYRDKEYTTEVAKFDVDLDYYYAFNSTAWDWDFIGDNTYYWRVQPDYQPSSPDIYGAWSQGFRLERRGFIPQNLQTSVSFATPTFSWDMVEGAEQYTLQIDDDHTFGSPTEVTTDMNSYTFKNTLSNGTYYWRVRVRRWIASGMLANQWTTPTDPCPTDPLERSGCIVLSLPTPTGLNHVPAGTVSKAPTLCWTPILEESPVTGNPVLAAWKYFIQVSSEPTFSSTIETFETEQACWTSIKGYADGTYYWRVAMKDGDGKQGDYSTSETFTKTYPKSSLISPLTGEIVTTTPTFIWTPVYGAAR